MNYSGMITAIASGLVAVTGDFYPLVAPMIGAIGTFVTGSDTSSNILFAKLQAHVANQLGMTGQSTFFGMEGGQENWLVAANTTGATGENPDPEKIPCYRVVNAKGELAGEFAFGGEGAQARLLQADGIAVVDGRVDLKIYGI